MNKEDVARDYARSKTSNSNYWPMLKNAFLAGVDWANEWTEVTPETEIEEYEDLQFIVHGDPEICQIGYYTPGGNFRDVKLKYEYSQSMVKAYRMIDTTPPKK